MKTNRFARFLSLALCLILTLGTLSLLPLTVSADADVNAFVDGNNAHVQVTEGTGVVGMHLKIGGAFKAFGISMPTYNESGSKGTLAVYQWVNNPGETLEAAPLAEKRFDNLVDNAMNVVEFGKELPAGDYFFCVKDTVGPVGVWIKDNNHGSKGYMYPDVNTETDSEFQMFIRFTDKPDTPFLPADKAVRPVVGPVVIPEDSLYWQNPAKPDTWVFTDGLGRKSVTYEEAGPVRENKTLALFFWSWHDELASGGATNTTKLIEEYPEAKNNYNHKAWIGTGHYCFWNEPIYGFYRTSDQWVLRKQVELLAGAGVDVVFNDNTNGANTWKSAYTSMFETWIDAMNDGVASPKISFLLPFGPNDGSLAQVKSLYNDLYSTGKYAELWYFLEDKPMLMAHNSNVPDDIKDAITWRAGQPEYRIGGQTAIGQWGWLHTYPQSIYYGTREQKKNKTIEEMTVGVAMNHNYVTHEITAMNGENVMGRSYTSTYPDRYDNEGDEASKWGYNFSEQFDYVLEKDPAVVFVTGWNEWHAWRQPSPWGGAHSLVDNALVDEFVDEFSRDLEPTKGALKDYYYYLFVNYARKYKGMEPMPVPTLDQTIDMTAGEAQWKTVGPYFTAYADNVGDRDADGYKGYHYTETSGRNDLIGAQVARDDGYLYFHVECASDITPASDDRWMNLYIDCDAENKGWEYFDYVVRYGGSADTLLLEKFTGEGFDTTGVADCAYSVDGRYMTVKIAKSDLGLSGDDYTVNFKWTDNVHDEGDYDAFSGDIMDFYISGDIAPTGRFCFSFVSTHENAKGPDPETEPETEAPTEPVTDAPVTDAPATEAPTEAEEETEADGGCKSVLSVSLLPALLSGAWLLLRKKERD